MFLVGCGVVGSELLAQIARQQEKLTADNIALNVYGLANSKGMVFNRDGIDVANWQANIGEKAVPVTVENLKQFVRENHLINPVLVDCTSNEALALQYVDYLEAGFNVVTPNKKANTDSWAYYQALRTAAQKTNRRFLYETTVGAGLPVIETVKNLHNSGEDITKIRGVFSGSLSYIFNRFSAEEEAFSNILNAAAKEGLTEPDSRDDLSGKDVARKLLILARELGFCLLYTS